MRPATLDENTEDGQAKERSQAAYVGDILALSRAMLDAVARAMRTSPEVRESRIMARWPLDLEALMLELEPMAAETPIASLAGRMGASVAQLRATAHRLQRMGLARVTGESLVLTAQGRQKLARLEMARSAVLRRVAGQMEDLPAEHARLLLSFLSEVIDRSETVVTEHLGESE